MKEGFEGSRPVLLSSPRLFESEALDGCSVDFGHEVSLGHGAVFVRDGAVSDLLHVDLAAEHDSEVVFLLALRQTGSEFFKMKLSLSKSVRTPFGLNIESPT